MSREILHPVRLPLKPILERIKNVLSVKSDGAVATALDISPVKLAVWKKRNFIPYELLVPLSKRLGVHLDWLLTGEGEMKRGAPAEGKEDAASYTPDDPTLALLLRKLRRIYYEGDRGQRAAVRGLIEELYDELRSKKPDVGASEDEGAGPQRNIA